MHSIFERKEVGKLESEVFELLYKRYYKEIYFYLYSMSKDVQTAEDIAQETFLKAILSLEEGHPNVRAWLYMVARNLYFNQKKKADRVSLFDEAQLASDIQSSDLLSGIIQSEQKRLLFSAMQSLSENKREVLQLQYFGGLPQQEIAAVLNLSAENVRVLALRGKRELRKYLEDNGYEIQ